MFLTKKSIVCLIIKWLWLLLRVLKLKIKIV